MPLSDKLEHFQKFSNKHKYFRLFSTILEQTQLFSNRQTSAQNARDPKANLHRIGKSHFNKLDSQIGSANGFEDFEIQMSRLLCASGQMYDCNTIAGCCAPDLAFPSKVGPGF